MTRVLVTRQPTRHHHPDPGHHRPTDPSGQAPPEPTTPTGDPTGLDRQLRAAMALLPPALAGAPTQPLEVGRTSRVIQPAQRTALAVRDGGCVFPDCTRPLAWCEAHHLRHWLHGGPTDLANLALLCRAHHRAVHEGGWRLARGPDGQLTATPPHRRHPTARATTHRRLTGGTGHSSTSGRGQPPRIRRAATAGAPHHGTAQPQSPVPTAESSAVPTAPGCAWLGDSAQAGGAAGRSDEGRLHAL